MGNLTGKTFGGIIDECGVDLGNGDENGDADLEDLRREW